MPGASSALYKGGAVLLWSWLACPTAGAYAQTGTLPASIPIFPLQDVMLFPHAARPLHIFEPRYREMLRHALATDRIIGMVMLRPGHESEYFGRPPIYELGCAGIIADVEELPDGRFNIVLRGVMKFRVKSEDSSLAFRIAEIEEIPEALDEVGRESLREHRQKLLEILASIVPDGSQPSPDELSDEELVNGLAQFLSMEPGERLELLELRDPLERAEALIEMRGPGVAAP